MMAVLGLKPDIGVSFWALYLAYTTIYGLIWGIGMPSWALYWTLEGHPGIYIGHMMAVLGLKPDIGVLFWALCLAYIRPSLG